jgi:hypothetical protein
VKALIEELPSRISALQSVITGEKVLHPLDHDYDMGVLSHRHLSQARFDLFN